jgi:general secretion pathway protein A
MYEQYYGLKRNAFSLTPDPAFLFLDERSKSAVERILYGIERREGFSLVVGDIGTGKTTLCWALLKFLAQKNIHTALIQNPMLSEMEILKAILQDLGVQAKKPTKPKKADSQKLAQPLFNSDWMDGMSKKQLIDCLNAFLVEKDQKGAFTVLLIDEAQNMPLMLFEQLRLLSNLETAQRKLFQIIFIGQLELIRKLESPALRQLNQRISIRFETKPLSEKDTERYILHRLNVAGSSNYVRFSSDAFSAVWEYSKGYPRLINLLCDRALHIGHKEQTFHITPRLVYAAYLNLQGKEAKDLPKEKPRWLKKLYSPLFRVLARFPRSY